MQTNISDKNYKYLFYILFCFSIFALLYVSSTLSISYKEALNVLDNKSLLTFITFPLLHYFPSNDIALRIPFIIFYAMSTCLMYALTKDYFKYESDRFINIMLFMMLPGMVSAAILVNTAIIVLFFTLLYLYYYKVYEKHNYYILFFCLLIDNSFAILYLALFFYAFEKKYNQLFYISLILFGASMSIYGFNTGGKPSGHLLDTFAIYASVFSPLMFIYFFYSQYRIAVKGYRSIYWYISFVALVFSLLFAFRQKVYIEDFAPFVIIAMPLMVKLFFHTFRVRLPSFRRFHYFMAMFVFFILLLNYTVIFYNKPIYLFLEKSKRHFVYKYSFAKELSVHLKENNINGVYSDDKEIMKRLNFYNIDSGEKYYLSTNEVYKNEYKFKFEFKYKNKEIVTYYIK